MAVALLGANAVVSRMATTGRVGSLTQGPPGRHQATVSVAAAIRHAKHARQCGRSLYFANIRGLHSNINSVHQFLQAESPNLLFLTECQVTSTTDLTTYNFPGYTLYQNFRPKGGVCCYAKCNISFENVFNFTSVNFDYSIYKLNSSGTIKYFCCIYRSPNASPDPSLFDSLTTSLTDLDINAASEITVLGDFNVHNVEWLNHSARTDDSGLECELFADLFNLTQLIKQPTRIPDNPDHNPYLLDLFLTTNPDNYDVEVKSPLGSSDHCLISATCESSPSPPHSEPILVTKWHYDGADWEGLRNFLANVPWNLFFSGDPDCFLGHITDFLKVGMETYIPHHIYTKRSDSPKWFDHNCARVLKQKSIAYNAYTKSHSLESYNYFKIVRNHAKALINLAKSNFLHKQANKLLNNPNDNKIFWSTLNSFKSNFNKASSVPPLKSPNGDLVNDPRGKANILANIFSSNSTLDDADQNVPLLNFNSPIIPALKIHTRHVQAILGELSIDKAPGPDEIPPIVLKTCSLEIAPILSKLYRLCLRTSSFPNAWKEANIQPIPKKGATSEPSNYRPIAITSTLSKVFEIILNKHIVKHLETNSLINDKQYGFRHERSTVDILTLLTHNFFQSTDLHGEVHTIALDISKAFDRVWHRSLLSKLPHYGLASFVPLISSYLKNRKIRVMVDGLYSDFHPINAGVPQGAVLAPTLFLIHINDLLSITQNSVHSYADDSTLHSSFTFNASFTKHDVSNSKLNTVISLNQDLTKIKEWGQNNLVSFNAEKTKYIQFSNRLDSNASQITFNEVNVPKSHSIDILGVTLNASLSWTPYVRNIAKNASRKMGLLYRVREFFTDEQVAIIYKSHVRSQMEYCSPLWSGCGAVVLRQLDKIQNKAVRLINNLLITNEFPPLAIRRDVASLALFYRYSHKRCSEELASIVPPLRIFPRSTRAAGSAHEFTLSPPQCRTSAYKNSFVPRTTSLWNSLPGNCFPPSFSPQQFKTSCYKHFMNGGCQ